MYVCKKLDSELVKVETVNGWIRNSDEKSAVLTEWSGASEIFFERTGIWLFPLEKTGSSALVTEEKAGSNTVYTEEAGSSLPMFLC